MSCCKFIHSFCCGGWTWISLKIHLISQRYLSMHITYSLFGGPRSDKMFVEDHGARAHYFCRHMLFQSMVSLKPESQMKNRKIPILDEGNTFQMRYGRDFYTFYWVHGTCLNFFLCAIALCTNMCYFKQAYLTSEKTKWKKIRNTHFSWWKKPFKWAMIDYLKRLLDIAKSL